MIALPPELVLHIFRNLYGADIIRSSLVCARWHTLAFDPSLFRNLFPKLILIDAKQGNISSVPEPYDRKLIQKIGKLYALQVEKESLVALVTVPQGLTLNTLIQLKPDNQILSIDPHLPRRHGHVKVDQTYRVALLLSILKDSRNQSSKDHQERLNRMGYEMPKMLPVLAVHIFAAQTVATSRLTFTRCDKLDSYTIGVGSVMVEDKLRINVQMLSENRCNSPAWGIGVMTPI